MSDCVSRERRTLIQPHQLFFNVPEAAEFIRVSESTLRRMIRSGRMRYIALGSRLVLERDDLVEFMRSLKTAKPETKPATWRPSSPGSYRIRSTK